MDISKLKEKDLPERRPGMSNTDWLLKCLLSPKGSKAFKFGSHAVLTGGTKMIPFLLEVSMTPGHKPMHRIRLLDLVVEIGGPLGIDDYTALLQLAQNSRSKKVAQKAFDVIETLCPQGRPSIVPKEILEPMMQSCRESTVRMARLLNIPVQSTV